MLKSTSFNCSFEAIHAGRSRDRKAIDAKKIPRHLPTVQKLLLVNSAEKADFLQKLSIFFNVRWFFILLFCFCVSFTHFIFNFCCCYFFAFERQIFVHSDEKHRFYTHQWPQGQLALFEFFVLQYPVNSIAKPIAVKTQHFLPFSNNC